MVFGLHVPRQFQVCIFATIVFIVFLSFPEAGWAVQQHGGAEGLISHQLGHLLFITGMLFLFIRLKGSSSRGPGWVEFKCFIAIVTLWNILTFYGHWHNELISPAKFVRSMGRVTGMTITSPSDVVFYLSRLDHLLLVPAFFFLLLALNKWRKTA